MAVIIRINSRYRIELDTYSWQISKWKFRSDRREGGVWEGISWHRTLQQAGEAVQKRLVADEDLVGTNDVIDALRASSLLIGAAILEARIPDSWLDTEDAEQKREGQGR